MVHPKMEHAGFGLGQRRHDHLDDLMKVLLLACLAILALIISEKHHPSVKIGHMEVLCVPSTMGSLPAPVLGSPAILARRSEGDVASAIPAKEDLPEMKVRRSRWVPERPGEGSVQPRP